MTILALTDEQRLVADHRAEAFVEACPGAGKTRTIVARLARLQAILPLRRGVAVLSFTNSAVEEFIERCHINCVDGIIRHSGLRGYVRSLPAPVFCRSWPELQVSLSDHT